MKKIKEILIFIVILIISGFYWLFFGDLNDPKNWGGEWGDD